MSQSDFQIDNVSRSLFRTENNQALQALASLSSGATEPATTYAYQLWVDTTANALKQRNAANNGWNTLLSLTSGEIAALSGMNLTGAINEKRSTIAGDATATPLWTAGNGNILDVTGTPTITDFPDAPQAGARRTVYFAAGTTITDNANIDTQGDGNYLVQAGDRIEVEALTTSTFKIWLQKKSETLNYSGFKNKIIGGDFTTNPWQRGTSFAAIASGAYSADRWVNTQISSAVFSILRTADAPTASQAGIFTQHCLHIDITTADASLAATDRFEIGQIIEGLNSASFGFGQAGSRFVTLSFWHKHTKAGIHCVSLANSAGDRSYVAEYTQDVSDTWQKSTVTFPVDTTGTWLYDSSIGLRVRFSLAAGTNFQTTANTWTAGNFTATANQVNNLDSTANNFKIALVQLEAGQTATAFETRSVGQEISLCERYYQYGDNTSRNAIYFDGNVTSAINYPARKAFTQKMRASPTVVLTNVSNTSFPATVGTALVGDGGFAEVRTANATALGNFTSSWTASAEF
jgi:hypothetical protein